MLVDQLHVPGEVVESTPGPSTSEQDIQVVSDSGSNPNSPRRSKLRDAVATVRLALNDAYYSPRVRQVAFITGAAVGVALLFIGDTLHLSNVLGLHGSVPHHPDGTPAPSDNNFPVAQPLSPEGAFNQNGGHFTGPIIYGARHGR